jgi:hypothetical protein
MAAARTGVDTGRLPDAASAPARPAVDVDWHIDVNALSVPPA